MKKYFISIFYIFLLTANIVYANELKTITAEQFIAEHSTPQRRSIVSFITKQFNRKSVTQKQLDELWNNLETRESLKLVRFQIIDQKLYASGFDEIHGYFRIYIKYFQKLLNQYKIKDVDFMIQILDELKQVNSSFIRQAKDIPIFMMSKDLNDPDESPKLILPEPLMLWNRYGELITKIKQANGNNSWENKIDKIYWRGATTGNATLPYNLKNFDKLPRLSLVILSKLYPDIIDAEFTSYLDEAFEDDSHHNLRKILELLFDKEDRRVSEIDHLKYKYLGSIDGNTCAWVRVPWIMYSNSVLVKQETRKIEWFSTALKPYVHYIPIKEDLTDIFQQFEWMKAHDKELQQISLNAQKLVQNELMPEHIDAHMALILNKYHEIQQDKKLVVSLPTAEEIRSFKRVSIAVLQRIKRNFFSWMARL